eukprot:TRINITY_DN21582_c0_g1_i2.p1 TRINITY_DN21582_c0_g1~~TRINITY_DN21582_c0_g1_i2.p1  ORF type:complete len:407 (+),score=78.25 TRINITY_DN21582_c0_g1_i2:79-1221(+)
MVEECQEMNASEWHADMDVESFILGEWVDEDAANALRAQSPEIAAAVIALGPLQGENPSALIMSRIKECINKEYDGTDIDGFLALVDDRARQCLTDCSQAVIDHVMEQGPLNGANPSAILMARLRTSKRVVKEMGGLISAGGHGGGSGGKGGGGGGSGGIMRGGRGPPAAARTTLTAAPMSIGNGNSVAAIMRGGRGPPAAARTTPAAAPMSIGNGNSVAAALVDLGAHLGQLSSAVYDYNVTNAELSLMWGNVLMARTASLPGVGGAGVFEWDTTVNQPPAKRRKQLQGISASEHQAAPLTEDKEERRNIVLNEVFRILQENGCNPGGDGAMLLEKIGNQELTALRKGCVSNLRQFLQSRSDVINIWEDESGRFQVALV